VELLLSRLADPGLPPRSVTIPTELIRRDSCQAVDPLRQTA
jgi:DNA-binding LacI/PurR family transcriptional regulator